MSSIGKVSATQNNPTSADEFSFWLTDDVVIAPFDMVAVPNANKSVIIGVIKEIYHNTDSNSLPAQNLIGGITNDGGPLSQTPEPTDAVLVVGGLAMIGIGANRARRRKADQE